MIMGYGFNITLRFCFSIGIRFDLTIVMILNLLTLIVSDMKKLVNINTLLCVIGCGALLGSNYIPVAKKGNA
jgi:hypothetical protein